MGCELCASRYKASVSFTTVCELFALVKVSWVRSVVFS